MLRYAISDGSLALGQLHARPIDTVATNTPPPAASVAGEPPAHLREGLLAHAASVASRQIDFFLLREPGLPAGQLASLSRDLIHIFAATPTRLLIHSRPDIAIATRAHGVHLPSTPGQLVPAQVRTLYACANLPTPTVSLSCHTEEDLLRACVTRPDLILFGAVFGKQVRTTPIHPGIGLKALREACTLAGPIPVLALGGVNEINTSACLQAGAAGIAAIRLFAPSQLK